MKALLRVRFRYLLSGFRKMFDADKKGNKTSKGKIIGLSLLLLYAFGVLLFFVTWLSVQMSVFVEMGLDWLYFSLFFLAGAAMTLLGSVYSTQNQMYHATDNDMLLSMPVKMEQICLSRVLFLLLGSCGYMLFMTLPAFIMYWVKFGMTLKVLFGYKLMFLCVVLLCQTISCVLGWLLHLILSKIRSKAIGSLLFMTVFLIVYFWAYTSIMTRFNDILGQMAVLGTELAELFTNLGGFFVWLGLGATGSASSLLIILGITVPVVVLGYFFMIATYRSSLLTKKAAEKAVRGDRKSRSYPPALAVCMKECRRFFTCSIYLTNMGVGVIMALVGGAAGVVFKSRILDSFAMMGEIMDLLLPGIFILLFGFLYSMSAVSAPSISLEGRSLWILGSLPMDGWTVLSGKLLFHLLATVPVSVIVTLLLGIVYGFSPVVVFFLVLFSVCMPAVTGIVGLLMGLMFPRFDWLNEVYPCKQSVSVLFTMLIMMGTSALSLGMYALGVWLTSSLGMAVSVGFGTFFALVLPGVLTGSLYVVLKRWGSRKMEDLLQSV